jgi:hypothetical protein
LKKSIPTRTSQCASRKVFQGVPVLSRSGAGSMPWSPKETLYRVSVHGDSEIVHRIPGRAPLIRVYPHDLFSFAIFTTRSAILSRVLGRPPRLRLAVPSYFLAARLLNQRRSVPGVTIPANCSRASRPRAFALTPSLRLCLSVNHSTVGSRWPMQSSWYTRISSMR